MIGLSRLKRAIADAPTGGMQTGTSKVQLKLCDAQRIEVEYGALIAERDAALANNAELVAQVEVLQDAAIKVCLRLDHDGVSTFGIAEDIENLQQVVNATPTQCLRDIQAEAGRAGFVAGYGKCWRESYGTKPNTDSVDEYADSYADRVKAGEV